MSFNSGPFGDGPDGYISYKVFQESQKGDGGRRPTHNSGCLTSIVSILGIIIVLIVSFAR